MTKRILLFLVVSIFFSFDLFAQRFSLFTQVGFSDSGYDRWYDTNGNITVGLIVPVSPSVSIVPFGTFGGNTKYYFFDDSPGPENVKAKANEFGGMIRYTALRTPKFDIYLQGLLSRMTLEYSGADSQNPVVPPDAKESSFTYGVGTGFVYKITNTIQWNILEVDLSYFDMPLVDRWLKINYKTGIILQFQRSK